MLSIKIKKKAKEIKLTIIYRKGLIEVLKHFQQKKKEECYS